jgi:hypothetical protein
MCTAARRILGQLALLAAAVWSVGGMARADLHATALFQGPALPEPIHQGDPWAPPETPLPKFLIEATTVLFEQGLADPRGCQYREIELTFERAMPGSARQNRAVTHGWILPADEKYGTRFAVCWNGLVYPLSTLDGVADINLNIKILLN